MSPSTGTNASSLANPAQKQSGGAAVEMGKRLRQEAREFPWKDALLRMAADVVLVNVAMLSAFGLWFLFYVVVLDIPRPHDLAAIFKGFVANYWLLWSFLALLIFQLSGFYTRARGYAGRYKALVVFRAVSLFMVIFVFSDYFLFRGALVPRGVAVIGWVLTLALIGGTRLTKHRFLSMYRVEHRTQPGRVEKVLVLGGAGYLGSALVPQLLARGYTVRVLDSFLFGEAPLAPWKDHPHCELVRGDVRDIEAIVHAVRGCDAVVHLAGIVGDSACEENQQLAIEVNGAAKRMLVDVARGCGVHRFVFASSCSVYGASDLPVNEHSKIAPLSVYAQTKADSENILLRSQAPDFHPVLLRLGTLFGMSRRMRFDLVVNLLVARAASAHRITIMNGDQWRPFLHVDDAARAFVVCLAAPSSAVSGEIFNVGSESMNHQLDHLGEKIAAVVPETEIERTSSSDRRNYRVEFGKIESRLGFRCERTLESGIAEILEAVRTRAIQDFSTEEFNNQVATRAYAQTENGKSSPLRELAALTSREAKPTPSGA
jgi:nucleoside-diphosphate-sugar epimerase